jgi:hypothetical protein
MIGGTVVAANRMGKASAQKDMAAQDQEQRIDDLEAAQAAPPAAAPVAAAEPAAAGGTDIVAQLTELKGLLDQGVLSPEEFDAAKQKLLAG